MWILDFLVLASSGVRHASLKARIRKIKMRCAGFVEVQVEETYSMLLLDEGQGSAVPEVLALPGSFSRKNVFAKELSHRPPDQIISGIVSLKNTFIIMHRQRDDRYLDEAQLVSFGFQTVPWSY